MQKIDNEWDVGVTAIWKLEYCIIISLRFEHSLDRSRALGCLENFHCEGRARGNLGNHSAEISTNSPSPRRHANAIELLPLSLEYWSKSVQEYWLNEQRVWEHWEHWEHWLAVSIYLLYRTHNDLVHYKMACGCRIGDRAAPFSTWNLFARDSWNQLARPAESCWTLALSLSTLCH